MGRGKGRRAKRDEAEARQQTDTLAFGENGAVDAGRER